MNPRFLRTQAAWLSTALLLAPAGGVAAAQVPENPDNPIRGNEITPEQQRAVERGLAWLAARQQADGSFGAGAGRGGGTAVTSLGAVAFMAAGNVPGRGRYGEQVGRAADYVLASAQPSGMLAGEDSHGAMYAHGFATLFLGEVYGMTLDDRVKEPLTRAVRLIQRSQNDQGGWRYQPIPLDADVSVTICMVMGLRAARDAGIKVEKEVIDKAVEYVKGCQNPDGGFNYMLGMSNNSAFPRSAAGVATLYYAGIYEGQEIDAGLRYLRRHLPGGAAGHARGTHYFYGQYYAAQAMFLAGGDEWTEWYTAVRDELLASQLPDGSWTGEVSNEYCTAMALIVLQMPNRYLPVFAGKGPGA